MIPLLLKFRDETRGKLFSINKVPDVLDCPRDIRYNCDLMNL